MEILCAQCRSPISGSESRCGVCEEPLCRKCRIFLSEEEFALLSERPDELRHSFYCGVCNDEHVEPFRAEYEETLEKARGVNILYKGSKSTVRILRKATQAIEATNVADRDEAILKLAFEAAKQGFNSVIDVEVSAEKIRNEGYQKSAWKGRGVPAEIKSFESER